MIKDSTKFQELVSIFEQNEHDLSEIPKNIVDKYGYACLANSLMFKEPIIPKYSPKIIECFTKHNFKTIESLVSFIKRIKSDINKLFAIFAYAALNIEYDVDLYFSDRSRSTTLEKVFETKKAVCGGYSLFFIEIAKLVNIDSKRIIIKEYNNYSKGYNYNVFNQPSKVDSDHSSVFISIDGVPFISEPTWASGYINDERKFVKRFDPQYFLIPLYKTLCDHYPTDENQLNFSFKHFKQSIKIKPFGICLKTESNPFVNISCPSGFLEQKYSCNGPIDSVSFNIYIKKGEKFEEIDIDGIASYQIIQTRIPKHEERCRFKTSIAFPEVGLYMVELYVNTKFVAEYYVNNLKKCACSVPLIYNPFHEQKFVPIKPKCILSNAKNGIIIRFAISKKKSNILYEIIKLKNAQSFDKDQGEKIDDKYGRYVKLEIPFDDEHYENQLCVTFPSSGRYCVKIYIENDEGSYTFYTEYFFNVDNNSAKSLPKTNPAYYMYKGRKFAPLKMIVDGNEIEIHPNSSYNLVTERNQVFKFKPASKDDEYYFELRKYNEKSTIEWPKVENVDDNDEYKQVKFTIPNEYCEYVLKCWVNDEFCINIPYIYHNIQFKEPPEMENNLLEDLRKRFDFEKVIDNDIKSIGRDDSVEKEIESVPDTNDIRS